MSRLFALLARRLRAAPCWLASVQGLLSACTGTLDAGENRPRVLVDAGQDSPGRPLPVSDSAVDADPPRGLLPVDEQNPIVVINDYALDSWQGEHALLASSSGRMDLVGIISATSSYWPDVEFNLERWQRMVTAARASGMRRVPDPIASSGEPLQRPSNGNIDSTVGNGSDGARFLVEAARQFGTARRPLVIATGSTLTDVADAYLMDPTLTERVVVVSTLGQASAEGAVMSGPNGGLDPWADTIVAQRLRYVQVSTYYEHVDDVPESRLGELPDNEFGAWVAAKQPGITDRFTSDQISVLAAHLPEFVLEVQRMSQNGERADGAPFLVPDPDGNCWFVARGDGALPAVHFWQLLLAPETYGP